MHNDACFDGCQVLSPSQNKAVPGPLHVHLFNVKSTALLSAYSSIKAMRMCTGRILHAALVSCPEQSLGRQT